jgi:hypothetical protein
MGVYGGPNTIKNGLVFSLDAGNTKSYPGSGTTWSDLSGNGNNGTLTNGVGYDSSNLGSLVFDGVDDNIQLGNASKFIGTSQSTFTINSWVKTNVIGQYKKIFVTVTQGTSNITGIYFSLGPDPSYAYFGVTTNVGEVTANYLSSLPTDEYFNLCGTYDGSNVKLYLNGTLVATEPLTGNIINTGIARISGYDNNGETWDGNISQLSIYNRVLTESEIKQNYNTAKQRYRVTNRGQINNPFVSPMEAKNLGYSSGNYYFQSADMTSPQLLEFENDYYESRGWVCVFRSPYRSTATTNKIDLSIPMRGLLVQRDALDLRAAVYWSNQITYSTVGGSGNNTVHSGYSPRRVILGGSGGHGIYATNQNQCNWSTASGAIGAGWDGSTCGSFPDDLIWGTGNSSTPVYDNRSGTWSHWVTWG